MLFHGILSTTELFFILQLVYSGIPVFGFNRCDLLHSELGSFVPKALNPFGPSASLNVTKKVTTLLDEAVNNKPSAESQKTEMFRQFWNRLLKGTKRPWFLDLLGISTLKAFYTVASIKSNAVI